MNTAYNRFGEYLTQDVDLTPVKSGSLWVLWDAGVEELDIKPINIVVEVLLHTSL